MAPEELYARPRPWDEKQPPDACGEADWASGATELVSVLYFACLRSKGAAKVLAEVGWWVAWPARPRSRGEEAGLAGGWVPGWAAMGGMGQAQYAQHAQLPPRSSSSSSRRTSRIRGRGHCM